MNQSSNHISVKRCQKFPLENLEDCFSILPGDIVSHILSCLPTKDAVKTSVLSRNWKHKWISIRDMNIDDKCTSLRGEDRNIMFFNFMSRLLLRTRNLRIRKFCLTCDRKYHHSYFETWISEVLTRNVEILEIYAPKTQDFDSAWCFSGWTSLTDMFLCLSCTLTVQVNTCFLNLKRLHLSAGDNGRIRVKIAGRVVTFPVLELLFLVKCELMVENSVEIHAPELNRFRTSSLRELKNYEIKIFAPKLETYEACTSYINNIVLYAPATSSVALSLNPFVERQTDGLQTYTLRKKFSDLEWLKLDYKVLGAIVQSKSRFAFPFFDRLKEFHAFCCEFKDVFELLQVLPPLKVLKISVLGPPADCETMAALPLNLISELKEVELELFSGFEKNMNFIKFILENVRNLRKFHVFVVSGSSTNFSRNLSKLKPKSPRCEMVVTKGCSPEM